MTKQNRVPFLFYISLLTSVLSVIQAQDITKELSNSIEKPNIIFILTDDLGYGDLGILFQNRFEQSLDVPNQLTPHLDAMAHDGVQLPQHYCAAPVCAPSRASLLLGQSQGHANVRDNQFDKALSNNYTLGTVMKKAGYSTVAFGKWGLQGFDDDAPNWTAHPLNRGFDYFLGYMRHRDGHEHYPKEGLYRGVKEVWENRTNITEDLDKCYTADLWTAAAKKWIVDHKKGKDAKKPFFMYLAYDTPHAVLELPTQAYPSGGGLNGGLQWLGEPGHMINTASGKIDSWINPDYANAKYDDDQDSNTPLVPWPDVYKRYATDTRRIDDAIGDIRTLLKDLKIDNNTIIVFTSDNGPSSESYLKESYHPTFFKSFGPFDGMKRDCWEGGVRMPTLALWPGHFPSGRVVSSPSISYDWMATMMDIVGLPSPAVSDGVSLLPSLTGVGKQQASNVYIEYLHNGRTPSYSDFETNHQARHRGQMQMLREGDFVAVRYDIKSAKDDFEIYNVVKDPKQTNNLATDNDMVLIQKKFKDMALQSRMPNMTAPRPYDKELVPNISAKNIAPGLIWHCYEGQFPWVPQVTNLIPIASGIADTPQIKKNKMKYEGAIYFEGFINVPVDGEYDFFITTNTGAVLRIHQSNIIDADYEYRQSTPKAGEIRLNAGWHPIKLYALLNKQGNSSLKLEWRGPGIQRREVPQTVFFHEIGAFK
tara:strand:- start:5017 stop:7131 length:2115 start_codon:yes stop_codon:yes gene_type:complete